MKIDLRYDLQHIGDIFVGAVQNTADSARQCSRAAFLTYDIKMLHCKKQRISQDIGERVTLLIKEGMTDVTQDAKLSELISQYNSIEKELVEHENQRSNLLNPFKTKKTACECTTNREEKENL